MESDKTTLQITAISRRSLITGLISFMAAPAIVRASSLMPVKSFILEIHKIDILPSPSLHIGDTITFAGIKAFNRVAMQMTDVLQQRMLAEIIARRTDCLEKHTSFDILDKQ